MPKFYVESGEFQLVADAENAHDAAVCAFHTFCERQSKVLLDASSEADDLQETMRVNEQGFGRSNAQVFDTLDVLAAWQGCARYGFALWLQPCSFRGSHAACGLVAWGRAKSGCGWIHAGPMSAAFQSCTGGRRRRMPP